MRRQRPRIPGPRVRRVVKRNKFQDEDDVAHPEFETPDDEVSIGGPPKEAVNNE
jgi:hypothetical protein